MFFPELYTWNLCGENQILHFPSISFEICNQAPDGKVYIARSNCTSVSIYCICESGSHYLLSRDCMKHSRRSRTSVSALRSSIYNHYCFFFGFLCWNFGWFCSRFIQLLWINSWPKTMNVSTISLSLICSLPANTSHLISHRCLNKCTPVCAQVRR